MKTILIANPKGGSGKTTLTVNIAGYLANRGQRVALLDLDRQQSASRWLALRPDDLPPIRILESKKEEAQRNDWLVIDSPAALHGNEPRPRNQASQQNHRAGGSILIRPGSQS